jgi:uncharacterized damage-inducible protein DinB
MMDAFMTDEELRIRGYLQAQASKLAPAAVVDKVRAAMAELRSAAEAVPVVRFDERPAPGEWSAGEVMAHVVEAGRHFGGAIVDVLDGRAPGKSELPARDGERRSAAEWCAMLEHDRAVLFARVARADPDAASEALIQHGMFGPLTWRETLLFMRLHDLDHAGQLRKIP